MNRHRKATHHIGAVRPVGDATKALGFALAHKGSVAHVNPGERGIAGRTEAIDNRNARRSCNASNN